MKELKKAAALKYDTDKNKAPEVIAIGKGQIAEKIIEKAEMEKVPVFNDPHLADALSSLKIGQEIPRELYEVVAEVLAFVSRMDKEYGR